MASTTDPPLPTPKIFSQTKVPPTVRPEKPLSGAPLTIARKAADKEIRNTATVAEMKYLMENPILWLRALTHIRQDILHKLELKRADLLKHQPPSNATAQQVTKYRKLKQEFELATIRRKDYTRRVERRIQDIKATYGFERAYIAGDYIDVLNKILQFLEDDDVETARSVCEYYLKRWSEDFLKEQQQQ